MGTIAQDFNIQNSVIKLTRYNLTQINIFLKIYALTVRLHWWVFPHKRTVRQNGLLNAKYLNENQNRLLESFIFLQNDNCIAPKYVHYLPSSAI